MEKTTQGVTQGWFKFKPLTRKQPKTDKDLRGICNKDLWSASSFDPTILPPGCSIRSCFFMPDISNQALKTGDYTKDKDLDSDKSEIVKRSPARHRHVGPSAAANKKARGNGEASDDDQISNQATDGESDPYNSSIFVDNLGTGAITAGHLKQIFAPFGELYCVVILTGTQCGYAEFFSRSSAQEAIENLNGIELAGQTLRMSFAKNEVRSKAIAALASDYRISNQATDGDIDPYNSSIFVDNLGTNGITAERLRQIFSPFGELLHVAILAGTQCGYVEFLTRRSADEAIRKLNGTELAGQNLRLSFANDEVRYKAIAALAHLMARNWAPKSVLNQVSDPVSDIWVKKYLSGASYDESSNQATHTFRESIEATHVDRDPKIPNNTSILVDNLVPNVVTEEQLRQSFTKYGEVAYVKIMKGTQFGFVQFFNRISAEEAIRSMNGKELAGQNLKLSFSNKEERGAEYLNNDLPYGWSGSGIFIGLPPLCSDSGLPTSGWFSAPSPFMCDQVIDPNDPRIEPTKEDVESDDAVWALYTRWCQLNNVCRTPEEMNLRLGYFKQNAIHAYECNRDYPSGRYGLLHWADDPSKCPRGGVII